MKFKDKYNIVPEFEELFSFNSEKEEIEHEAKMMMFRFLSEVEKLNSTIKKKELVKALDTSASYITQLFNGDKLINLKTLAKIQKAYNISFEIKAVSNLKIYKHEKILSNIQQVAEKQSDKIYKPKKNIEAKTNHQELKLKFLKKGRN